MSNPVNKSVYPPPPPFYQLYTLSKEQYEESVASAAGDGIHFDSIQHPPPPPPLPIDIWQPPPPLEEAFLKFGEVQSPDFEVFQLPPDVKPLYVVKKNRQLNGISEEGGQASQSSSTDPSTVTPIPSSSSTSPSPSPSPSAPSSSGPYPPNVDHVLSLRLLNREYLRCYINLLNSLTTSDSSSDPNPNPDHRVEDFLKQLNEISTNFALLLTQLRPHQANQTMMQVMMKQIEKRKKKKEKVER